MRHLARGIDIFENSFSDIFLENWTSHVRCIIGKDKKVLSNPTSIFSNGIIYPLPVDDQERDQHNTRHWDCRDAANAFSFRGTECSILRGDT
jgi:hypothetical protein